MTAAPALGWRGHSPRCLPGNFSHLYRIPGPATLESRFESVDLEAITTRFPSEENFTSDLRMTGPLPYIGGKNRIANKIVQIFPEHTAYVEAFAGGAQVLFHKEPSHVEVLNDLDGEVVNFFRVCQQHHEELLRCLRFILVSRKWFEIFENQNPESLTDIQRAARFFYIQKTSYAGLVRHHNYNYSAAGPPSFNPGRLPELIDQTHERLQRVQIECLPYEEILKRFDRPLTLFYLDPPYFGRKLYKFNFSEEDFVALEKRLKELRGKFVLSLNDVPEVRRIFHRFHFREIELAYTAQQAAGKRYPELLITNYRLREANAEVKP
jgi:DNA adenine methylase